MKFPYDPDFAVFADGRRFGSATAGVSDLGRREKREETGAPVITVTFGYEREGIEIDRHRIDYDGFSVMEQWLTIRNTGHEPLSIDRIDSFCVSLPREEWRLLFFRSDWGAEFEPEESVLQDTVILETLHGRSSKGMQPWMTLIRGNGGLLNVCPVWSGNWILRCMREEDDAYRMSGGLHDRDFQVVLAPGEALESIRVVMAAGSDADLNTVSVPLARIGRKFWYPRNALSQSLPVEWNHWWTYEDRRINETVFLENAEQAANLGIEVCTLDAGWFGPDEAEAPWYDYRGDWDLVNRSRFPGGIRRLSDEIHEKGMMFGLWCEIEALGERARLGQQFPDFAAARDGERLGYLCFGNPEVRDWAFRTLDRLIREYGCDWIKLDFNLDPASGCNRTDHGHGAGDGLFRHYQGYYEVLDRVREAHPDVLLENCASGGLRNDLGIMRHAHVTFLSDPDWPEHSLQVFWGATTFLAPNACLHWSYSDWLGQHPEQRFKPDDPGLGQAQFDFYTRISMMRGFGFSQNLPGLPDWIRERIAFHVRVYRTLVNRFVKDADLYRLTGQPLRGGKGDRWTAFQYSMPDGAEHLLFVFRLSGADPRRYVRLTNLAADGNYELAGLPGARRRFRGSELMGLGIRFEHMAEEESALIHIRRTEE
ncbi:alpha-galactosidase [Cohnella candidum]|uniref:alpha-galactosidase n=1 Tax=Cohnella candidum TaxID=2674991 RepID=A0A3G3K065_9BACL|nr:alpha-galactosidase [Cohnella candidum]AYQ73890.1 alpha-galactosidase [Cohnella candidum]